MRQLKNSLKFLTLGLLLVLTACSGAEASQPASLKDAPAEIKPEAPPVDQSQPQAGAGPAVEEAMAATTEKTEIPTAEPAAETTVMPEKTATTPEAAPTEEKAMTGPADTTPTGPTEAQLELLAGLENRGAPPELFNEVWLNSEPLKLADLRGQVVIIEFWTFG